MAVDVSSADDSGELLRKALGERNVLSFDSRKGGFGAAVAAALEFQRSRGRGALVTSGATATGGNHDGQPVESDHEWIWLLQDDAAPAPDALERLMEAAERSTTAAVVGCKQLDWDEPRRLVDVGVMTNQWFDRHTLIELDELDQGQYDARTDVFAVNAAGMLVRRDVWEKLGGFDPAVPGPGDDLDFCARVHLSGPRVIVVPAAKMFHAGDRPNAVGTGAAARKAAVFLRLKHAPLWQLPLLWVGTLLSSIYWFFAGFLMKAPGHAVRMFAASCAGLLRPVQLARSRRALAMIRTKPRSVLKELFSSDREARTHLKLMRETVGPSETQDEGAMLGPSILEPTGDAHQQAISPLVVGRTAPLVGALGLVVLLTALALTVSSRLLSAQALSGGALLAVSSEIERIWQHATSWWVSLGSGLPGHGNPFNYVLWLLSGMGLGNGSAVVLWITVLAVPLAALSAWVATGALSRRRWPRIVFALAWAAAPALQLAAGEGRFGALLAHLLIPLAVLGLIRAAGAAVGSESGKPETAAPGLVKLGRAGVDGNPSWTAAAAAGLVLAAITAAAPLLFPVAVIAVLGATLFLGRRGKTLWWSLVPPAALFLPFIVSAWGNPRALLADPGLPLASNPASSWLQLLGFPAQISADSALLGMGSLSDSTVATWVAVILIGAPVVILALISLLLPLRRAGLVRTFWLLALLALAAAYGSNFLAVAVGADSLVTPFNGPAVSLAAFALLGAALLGFDAVHRRAFVSHPGGTGARSGSKVTAVVLSFILVAAPVASLGLWSMQKLADNPGTPGLTGTTLVGPAPSSAIPATAADRGLGPEGSRTIVLEVQPDASVQASLVQGDGTTLDALSSIALAERITGAPGKETLTEPDAASSMLRETVAAMMAKSGIDPRANLTALGVGFVVVRHGDTAAELLASELEAVPGLDTVGPTNAGWLWRVKPGYQVTGVTDVVNRVRLVDAKGAPVAPVPSDGVRVDADIAAGDAGRRVVMAERFDAGFTATLDGEPLNAVQDGWAQAFELPATAGHLEIRYVQPWNMVLVAVQIILLGLTMLLALPVRARRGRTGAYRDEASLQKVGRGV